MNPLTNDPLFRYKNDVWYFGVLLIDGTVLGISQINETYDYYIDVTMLDLDFYHKFNAFGKTVSVAPTSRLEAKIRKEHIIAICELADT